MKNKGFTLIELLAVIVILAIIALIATPIVLNIIKDSKSSSIERSAELYLDQVKNEIARYNMTHPSSNFNPSECIVQSGDSLICDGTSLNIEINGDKPSAGSKIFLSNGSITGLEDFKVGSKNLTYENGKIKEGEDNTSKSSCTAVTEATTGNVPGGSFNYGDEYICDVGDSYTNTFFVLENNSDTVSLIMKENYTDSYVPKTLAWCTDGTMDNTTCKNITSTGSNASTGKDYLGHIKNIFNKEGITVNFPSANQIAIADGKNYLNRPSLDQKWLYDYLNKTTHPVSGVSGYWTITLTDSDFAWVVDSNGSFNYVIVTASYYGIRPVITIPKSELN